MSQKTTETTHVLGLQNFINYERMNPLEVSLDSNYIIERLAKYKKFKYRFLVEYYFPQIWRTTPMCVKIFLLVCSVFIIQ